MTLDGRVAIVVGGHSGLGEAISRRFAADGARVVIAARRLELARQVADEIGGAAAMCDITDDEQVEALVAAVVAEHGGLDVAVNSAGFEQSTALADLTPERLRAMQAVQLDGALFCMRHMGNAMAVSGGGAYLTVSSLTAHNPTWGLTAYGSAKAGVEYATKIAAVEYGPQGVRFNCVASALIETPMTSRIFRMTPVIQAMVELTPLGFMGAPSDIADAAAFLCSDQARYVTGQTLCVDGGASLLALPTPQMLADVSARVGSA